MHTIKVIASGLLLLVICLGIGRMLGGPGAVGASVKLFIVLWLFGAAANLWFGVSRAGYSVIDELPIFLVVFLIPVAVALYIRWKY